MNPLQSAEGPKDVNKVMARLGQEHKENPKVVRFEVIRIYCAIGEWGDCLRVSA